MASDEPAILVVEDDPAIRQGLVDALEFGGYRTFTAERGDDGLEQALAADLDLVILDVLLPGMSGFEMLEEIRRSRPRLPVILVTARGAETDRIHGLRAGADDYVVKPFSVGELLARVEAVLRRSAERPLDVRRAEIAGRRIDLDRREVVRADGQVVRLSERETEILRYLLANPDRVLTREELLRNVWGLDPRGLHTRTVDMHVARLREKLGDTPSEPRIITTVRGGGYMLARAAADG